MTSERRREQEEHAMRHILRSAIEPPSPDLADRVVAAIVAEPGRHRETRQHSMLSLVAVALAATLVITLVYGARLARRGAVPGPNAPVAGEVGAIAPVWTGATGVQPFLTSGAGVWVAELRASGRTTIYRSAGAGQTWTPRLDYAGGLPSQLLIGAAGEGVLVAGQRDPAAAELVLFRTSDGGASWQRVPPPIIAQEWGVPYFADAGRGWVLASLGPASAEILSTADGGRTWAESSPFNDRANFPGLSSARLRILWTSDGRGFVLPPLGAGAARAHVVLTEDGGATWRASFPAVPPGQDVTAGNAMLDAGLRPDGSGALFLQPVDVQRGGASALFAYGTGDAGRSWRGPVRIDGAMSGGPPRALFALDDQRWWSSSGSGADLLVTADGGRTVHRHARALPAGYVFRSIGFSTAAEGWAVATAQERTAVFLSHDGGATWHPLVPPS
jgi:photosystem II stability/assembly factor-like uncharacterized protein